jgi:peptidoglycan hydrolase-like protein with peptidoglycan-binding domain
MKRIIIENSEKDRILSMHSEYKNIQEQMSNYQLSSEDIHRIQIALNTYFKQKNVMENGKLYQITVDEKWGPETIKALKKFQGLEKLNPDGIPGPETRKRMVDLGIDGDIFDKIIKALKNLF